MMDTVRTFSEYVLSQIQEHLPERYQEADCRIQEVLRNNGVYGTAMEFDIQGENAVCCIHMDPYYAEFKQGRPIAEIMKEIVIQIQETYEIEKLMKESHIEDFQCMKPYLKVSLVNTGRNRQRLLSMPHMEMEDLSIVCRVEIPSPEGYGRVEVTNDILFRHRMNAAFRLRIISSGIDRKQVKIYKRIERKYWKRQIQCGLLVNRNVSAVFCLAEKLFYPKIFLSDLHTLGSLKLVHLMNSFS